MDNITHSGNTIDTAMPSPFGRAGTDLAILKLEQRVSELELALKDVQSDLSMEVSDSMAADEKLERRIAALEAENAALREELSMRGSGKALSDRILNYFLNESSSKSIRSSALREKFSIKSKSHTIYAMRSAVEKSNGKLILTTFPSKSGDEYALVKIAE